MYEMYTHILWGNFTTKSREHNVSRIKKKSEFKKKSLHSNVSRLPEDLTCLLSKPHAKNNAAQIVSPLSV